MYCFGAILQKNGAPVDSDTLDIARRTTWIARDVPRKGVEPTVWRSTSGRLVLLAWGGAAPFGLYDRRPIVQYQDFALAGSGFYYHPDYATPEALLSDLARTSDAEKIISGMGGTFAICMCNGRTDELHVWRSIAGGSAFYRETKQRLVVGTRGLFVSCVSSGEGIPQYDWAGLGQFCVNGFFTTDLTAFAGVTPVPAHSRLTSSSNNNVTLRPIDSTLDDFGYSDALPTTSDFDELAHLFLESMRPLKQQGTRISLGLSGGRDSRLLAAALHAADVPARIYCGRNWSDHPDLILGQRVAALLGLDLAPIETIDSESATSATVGEIRVDPHLCGQLRRWDGRRVVAMRVPYLYPGSFRYTFETEEEHVSALTLLGSAGEVWRGGYARRTYAGTLRFDRTNAWKIFNHRLDGPTGLLPAATATAYREWIEEWFDHRFHDDFPAAPLEQAYLDIDQNKEYIDTNDYSALADARLVRFIGKFAFASRNNDLFHFETIRRFAPQLQDVPLEGSRWQFELDRPNETYQDGYEARKPLPYGRISRAIPSVRDLASVDLRPFFVNQFAQHRDHLDQILDPVAFDDFLTSRDSLRQPEAFWFIEGALLLATNQWLAEYDIGSEPTQRVRLDARWPLIYGAVYDAVDAALKASREAAAPLEYRLRNYLQQPSLPLPGAAAFRHEVEHKDIHPRFLEEDASTSRPPIHPDIEAAEVWVSSGREGAWVGSVCVKTPRPRSQTSWVVLGLGSWRDLAGWLVEIRIRARSNIAEARQADFRLRGDRPGRSHFFDTSLIKSAPSGVEADFGFRVAAISELPVGPLGDQEEVVAWLPIGPAVSEITYHFSLIRLRRDEYVHVVKLPSELLTICHDIIKLGTLFSEMLKSVLATEVVRHALNSEKLSGLLSDITIADETASIPRVSLRDVAEQTSGWLEFQFDVFRRNTGQRPEGDASDLMVRPYLDVMRVVRHFMHLDRGAAPVKSLDAAFLSTETAAAVSDNQGSGFRAILRLLRLPTGARVLDVGAGGFLGTTTTVHLLDAILRAKVVGIELDPIKAQELKQKFAGEIVVFAGPFESYAANEPQDLVVFDLHFGAIPLIIDSLLERAAEMLKPGGHIISLFIYDLAAVFDSIPPLLHPSVRPDLEDFLMRRFRALQIDPHIARTAFAGTGLTVCGIVDKWMGSSGVGWIVLQK